MRRDSRLSLALHVLAHLAGAEGPATSAEMAQWGDTNAVVVRRVLAGLRKARIVTAEKGHGGGWTLARPLSEITLKQVYDALDTPVLVQQSRPDERSKCRILRSVHSALESAYSEAEELIIRRFATINLKEVLEGTRSHA